MQTSNSKITHIEMHASTDVGITQEKTLEKGVFVQLYSTGPIRYSIIGKRLTIESRETENECSNIVDLPGVYLLDIQNIVVTGTGTLNIETILINGTVTMNIYNIGGIDLEDDGTQVLRKINISNHHSARIRGFGTNTACLKVNNTSSGSVSGFLVEKSLDVIISGSGQILLDKYSNCRCNIKKIASAKGTISFVSL